MNAATAQQPHSNNVLDLGTRVRIDLRELAGNEGRTVDQLIAALEMTTNPTDLTVDFKNYEPTPENNRRIVEPLCNCLSNLRGRNEHHPLRALTLRSARLRSHAGMSDVVQQFLVAAKYGGIYHLKLIDVHSLPVQFFVEFCRNNNNFKVMEAYLVSFSDCRAALSVPPNRPQDSSVVLVLDKLVLHEVLFNNSTAATEFANLFARLIFMVLGRVAPRRDIADADRIMSELMIPSVKQLKLIQRCQIEHFKAALEAGTTSLVELDVVINYDDADYTERLELLANFIRRAVQLNSLKIIPYRFSSQRPKPPPPPELLWAIEACATVTEIQLNDNSRETETVQQLQTIAARNRELARFVAHPGNYSIDDILALMRQFDHCLTGRYMLVRCLPGVLAFETIIPSKDSPTKKPKRKKARTA